MAQAPALSASLGAYQQTYEDALRQLDASDFEIRLTAKDPSLWNGDEAAIAWRLGWLTVPQGMLGQVRELAAFAEDVKQAGFERVVLLGMGGSSLAPEVMSGTFGAARGHPSLVLLDTTDGATITGVERTLNRERTLFVVSSKSGTTTETASLHSYFAEKQPRPLTNFIAITDPGTPLEARAKAEGFRTVYLNRPDVGGRFSALSYFGLVPAAAMGIDIDRLLGTATSLDARSGVELGAMLGGLAVAGRDKVTFVVTPSLRGFGAWAEQLLAESTGKLGKGIIPVDGEPLGAPDVYGDDRVFVYLRLAGEPGPDEQLGALEAAGHPMITIILADRYDLGAEFLRWEIATAAAGAILGINPFDEPNVAEAKERASEILRQNASADDGETPQADPEKAIHDLLASARPGDYLAILAFISRTAESDGLLTRLRIAIRRQAKLATSVGFGPRYLHSTGQLFKGGPDTGLFIQVIADDSTDVPIPGVPYSFGTLKRAQALGDLQALQSRGRRVVRVNLGTGGGAALERIVSVVESKAEDRARAAGA